jgi:hypothetical protein
MNIIFLDIDGVLVTNQSPNMRSPTPRCVKRLNELCSITGARLVVSSVWRMKGDLEYLNRLLSSWGVEAEVVGKTPCHMNERGDEIAAWLEGRADVESFVIIDDDSDMGALLPWLVKTRFEYGITHNTVERAIRTLRHGASL